MPRQITIIVCVSLDQYSYRVIRSIQLPYLMVAVIMILLGIGINRQHPGGLEVPELFLRVMLFSFVNQYVKRENNVIICKC